VRWLGIDDVPDWVREESIDTWVFNIGLTILLLSIAFLLWRHRQFDRIDGRITYLGQPLGGGLEKLSAPMMRGQWNRITLRQWLSRDIAEHMKQNSPAKLGTGNFGIWFVYTNHLGKRQSVRQAFPDDIFSVGDAWPYIEATRPDPVYSEQKEALDPANQRRLIDSLKGYNAEYALAENHCFPSLPTETSTKACFFV
jgi:hypothetical protein